MAGVGGAGSSDRAERGSRGGSGGGEGEGERVGSRLQRHDGHVRESGGGRSDWSGEGDEMCAAERVVGGGNGSDDTGNCRGEAEAQDARCRYSCSRNSHSLGFPGRRRPGLLILTWEL